MSETINQIAQQYHTATHGWHHYLFPYANKLFASLAVIELAWCGIWWAIEKNDVSSLFAEFLKKIMVIGFFYALLLHANQWIPSIIESFMAIGSGATKYNKIFPGDIFDQGASLAGAIVASVPITSVLLNGLSVVLLAMVAALVVIAAFSLITAQLVVALIEAYVIVGAGVLLLGFSGHSFTRHLALNYVNYAISTGVKLLMLFMVISVGANLADQWQQMIYLRATFEPAVLFEVIGGTLIFLYVVHVLPGRAQGLVTGQANFDHRDIGRGIYRVGRKLLSSIKSSSTQHNKNQNTPSTVEDTLRQGPPSSASRQQISLPPSQSTNGPRQPSRLPPSLPKLPAPKTPRALPAPTSRKSNKKSKKE
jgi:type IV secretion system protein TrbL